MVDFASDAVLSEGVTRCVGNDMACSSSSPDVSVCVRFGLLDGGVWNDFVNTFIWSFDRDSWLVSTFLGLFRLICLFFF